VPASVPNVVDLDHRAYFLRRAPHQGLVAAASREGAVSLVDLDSLRITRTPRLPRLRDLSPHPTRSMFAVIDDTSGALSLIDFDGSRRLNLDPPRPRKRIDDSLNAGFLGCYFDSTGQALWTVARVANEAVEVQLRDTERWSVVASVTVEDPFDESDCSFFETCRPDVAALWLAAGQNGQRVFWVTKHSDRATIEPEPFLENTTPPVFSPNGTEFLAIDELNSVCRFPFPADRKLGACRSKWGDDDHFSDSICYLDDRFALVHTHNQRLFRIDLRAMKLREEVIVRGHEPRPLEEFYSSLAGDMSISTDIDHFTRLGDVVILVSQRLLETKREVWKNTLLIYGADSLARQTSRSESS
jgi:hypothetical protein